MSNPVYATDINKELVQGVEMFLARHRLGQKPCLKDHVPMHEVKHITSRLTEYGIKNVTEFDVKTIMVCIFLVNRLAHSPRKNGGNFAFERKRQLQLLLVNMFLVELDITVTEGHQGDKLLQIRYHFFISHIPIKRAPQKLQILFGNKPCTEKLKKRKTRSRKRKRGMGFKKRLQHHREQKRLSGKRWIHQDE